MHETETRALKRAVVILLVVSVARLGWSYAAPAGDPSGEDVLAELLEGSQGAVDEAQARSEPLAEGERVDPNRADEVQLDRLPGVGPATARAIVEARDAGLVFRRPEDLEAVRGIGPVAVARLAPHLDLDRPPVGGGRSRPASDESMAVVDVNRATGEELEALPGIGPALAERILAERRKRMFTSMDDLLRVQGVGPATLERLRGRIRVSGGY